MELPLVQVMTKLYEGSYNSYQELRNQLKYMTSEITLIKYLVNKIPSVSSAKTTGIMAGVKK